jgi:hypothetical protein
MGPIDEKERIKKASASTQGPGKEAPPWETGAYSYAASMQGIERKILYSDPRGYYTTFYNQFANIIMIVRLRSPSKSPQRVLTQHAASLRSLEASKPPYLLS